MRVILCKQWPPAHQVHVLTIMAVYVLALRGVFVRICAVGCPTVAGFRKTSQESYNTHAVIQAYDALGALIDQSEFVGAAVEFGGSYQCQRVRSRER